MCSGVDNGVSGDVRSRRGTAEVGGVPEGRGNYIQGERRKRNGIKVAVAGVDPVTKV